MCHPKGQESRGERGGSERNAEARITTIITQEAKKDGKGGAWGMLLLVTLH